MTTDDVSAMTAAIQAGSDRRRLAPSLYSALRNSSRYSSVRKLAFRCWPHRCLLLEAVDTPEGIILHQPPFKQSEAENEARSSAAARARSTNTSDGNRHWKARTYFIDSAALGPPDTGGILVRCDHVLDQLVSGIEFHEYWNAETPEVRVRPDGSRYVL